MSDSDLVSLFTSAYPKARGYAFVLTKNKDEAEDLVQRAFLKAAEKIDQYDIGTNFDAWIRRIIKNTFLDVRKSYEHQNVSSIEEIDQQDKESSMDLDFSDPIFLEKVNDFIDSWGQRDSQIIRMHAGGFDYNEIAEDLDLTPTNVGAILCRRRQQLAENFANG